MIKLNEIIDWENFRYTLEKIRDKERKSQAGRKPYDVILMFKVLVLQHLHHLSDDATEYQIRDRYSFCRFFGLFPRNAREENAQIKKGEIPKPFKDNPNVG